MRCIWVIGTVLLTGLLIAAAGAPVLGDHAARPGYGLVYTDNASPVTSAPPGHGPGDWEWRPLYVNNNNTYGMTVYPTLVANVNYWFSASGWKSRLTGTLPWSTAGLYCHERGPSAVFRKYGSTLYCQINGQPIPNPQAVEGYTIDDYYYNRYSSTGTIPFNALPSQWYLDPFRRMVVESAFNSWDGLGSWGLYGDMATIFEDCNGAGAQLGAAGVGFYLFFLACEYALVIEYDNMVMDLEEQARIYRSYFTPSEHDYFSLDDPGQNRTVIVQRKVPNYSTPSGVDGAVAPARGCIGSFTFNSGTAAGTLYDDTKQKAVTINETFTTASIPFQFALEMEDQNPSANSKAGGRFSVRAHAPAAGGNPERWVEMDIAGTKAGQWISPWAFVSQRDTQSAWNATKNDGSNVGMSFATGGQSVLSANWAGELIIRAADCGVDRFDRIEFVLTSQAASGGNMRATSRVALQPIFSRNISEAGPPRAVQAGSAVSFSAEANALPSNTSSTTYTWTFGDGQTATGQNVTHTFANPGIYHVLLKTDPQVPTQAPNAGLFNDAARGFSFDTCRVSVSGTAGGVYSTDPSVSFSNVTITASSNAITASWTSSVPTSTRLDWSIMAPNVVGPPAPDQAGSVGDPTLTTNHSITVTGRPAGTTHYLQLRGSKQNSDAIIYVAHNPGGAWADHTWTITTPAAGAPSVVVTGASAGAVSVTNLRFDAAPGRVTASWNTSVATTGQLKWATTPTGTPTGQIAENTSGTGHTLTATGLTNGTTYYFSVLNTPAGGSPVAVLYNGVAPWDVTVPMARSGGSRGDEPTLVLYATAEAVSGTQTKYTAYLPQDGICRMTRQMLPDGAWINTNWAPAGQTPNWTMGTTAQKAYKFAFEVRQIDGQTSRSREWVHVAGGPSGGEETGGGTGTGDEGTHSGEYVAASDYRAQGTGKVAGWDWLRSNGASATWEFNPRHLPSGHRDNVTLVFEGLITNGPGGGAGYSSVLTIVLRLPNGKTQKIKLPTENPYKPINPNLRNGTGYSVHGASARIPKAFMEAAVDAGTLSATLTWPEGVNNRYHVAVRAPALVLQPH